MIIILINQSKVNMIENILHKKIGGANLFSYFLVSALALAPSVSFADTTDNNVVTASASDYYDFVSYVDEIGRAHV